MGVGTESGTVSKGGATADIGSKDGGNGAATSVNTTAAPATTASSSTSLAGAAVGTSATKLSDVRESTADLLWARDQNRNHADGVGTNARGTKDSTPPSISTASPTNNAQHSPTIAAAESAALLKPNTYPPGTPELRAHNPSFVAKVTQATGDFFKPIIGQSTERTRADKELLLGNPNATDKELFAKFPGTRTRVQGELGAIWHKATEPTLELHKITAQEVKDVTGIDGTAGEVIAGLGRGGATLAESFTSPMGMATLGGASSALNLPKAVNVGLGINAAKEIPAQLGSVHDAIRDRDWGAVAERSVGAGASLIQAGALAKQALPITDVTPAAPSQPIRGASRDFSPTGRLLNKVVGGDPEGFSVLTAVRDGDTIGIHAERPSLFTVKNPASRAAREMPEMVGQLVRDIEAGKHPGVDTITIESPLLVRRVNGEAVPHPSAERLRRQYGPAASMIEPHDINRHPLIPTREAGFYLLNGTARLMNEVRNVVQDERGASVSEVAGTPLRVANAVRGFERRNMTAGVELDVSTPEARATLLERARTITEN